MTASRFLVLLPPSLPTWKIAGAWVAQLAVWLSVRPQRPGEGSGRPGGSRNPLRFVC